MKARSIVIDLRHDIHAAHLTKLCEGHATQDLVAIVQPTRVTIGTLEEWRASSDPARDLTYHRDFPAPTPHHLRTIVDLPEGPAFFALDTEPHAIPV